MDLRRKQLSQHTRFTKKVNGPIDHVKRDLFGLYQDMGAQRELRDDDGQQKPDQREFG